MKVARGNGGFTVIEVLIAIMMLGFGVLILAGTAGGITRMIGNGQRKTESSAIAMSRLELLRRIANSTDPKCTALAGGTATHSSGFSERWRVTASGDTRDIEVIVTYRSGPFAQADTIDSTLLCD